jgi:hypothetical protein
MTGSRATLSQKLRDFVSHAPFCSPFNDINPSIRPSNLTSQAVGVHKMINVSAASKCSLDTFQGAVALESMIKNSARNSHFLPTMIQLKDY